MPARGSTWKGERRRCALGLAGACLLAAPLAAADAHSESSCAAFYTSAQSRNLREDLGVTEGFRRCALVGSSGLLRRQRVAEEIDDHDMVMRFNLAPVDGYEEIVGSRTTLRMLNSEAVYEALQCSARYSNRSICPDYTVVLNTFRKDFAGSFRSECSDATHIVDADPVLNNDVVHKLTPQFKHPMSGSVGVALALALCKDRVDVYGFTHRGNVQFNDQVPYHYYGEDEQKGFIDVLLDSLPETAKMLSDLADDEAKGCLHLDAPSELQPLLNRTSVAADVALQDPLSQPPGGCGHSVANLSFTMFLVIVCASAVACIGCCCLCWCYCRGKKRSEIEEGAE
mmetsp:Transcript_44529/g.105528  ORF Transcript_44529/g.105528 Transcript_44529/m.105528 type:complete len:341 (-) Transcript_44529:157-1179(-)